MTKEQAIRMLSRDLGGKIVVAANLLFENSENYEAYFELLNGRTGYIDKSSNGIVVVWSNKLNLCLN